MERSTPRAGTRASTGTWCAGCGDEIVGDHCVECGDSALLDGRYRLTRRLGGGSWGEVWLAHDVQTGASVAIKELPLGRAREAKERELMLREVAVLAQLDHPRVPTYHRHLETGRAKHRRLWIVEQHVDGQNLAHAGRQRPDEHAVLAVLDEVLEVLEYLHTRCPPVIHRDVKPENLVRHVDGRLFLVDFGAVRDRLRGTLGGSTLGIGTFGYMAPEALAGDASARSDLYSVGATAFYLFSGRSPAEVDGGPGRGLDWRAHVQVSDGTAALLADLLAVDPSARPASATHVRARIAELLRPRPATRPRADLAPKAASGWETALQVLGVVFLVGAIAAILQAIFGGSKRS